MRKWSMSNLIHPHSMPTISHEKLVSGQGRMRVRSEAKMASMLTGNREGVSEYAALQRMVGTLQETLLRGMSEGQQVAAQQMQHDFTLKLQLAQTRFTQQLSVVQGSRDLIAPLGLEQWVVDVKLLSAFRLPYQPGRARRGTWRTSGIRVSERVSGHTC